MMINRRRVCGGKSLPYDAEIEYIKSSGTQWIDTGYAVTTQNVRIVSRYYFINIKHDSETVWGAQTANDKNWIANQYGNKWWFGTTTGQFGGSQPSVATDVEWTINNGIVSGTVGATSYSGTYSGSVVSGYSIYLFAANHGGQATRYNNTHCKLFKFQLYENGVLVRDFIPVRVGTTGYLYDKVSGQLFGNAGTGDFILGPDKLGILPAGYTQVEYIERGANNAYIDTGCVLDFSETIELKMSVISWNGIYDRIFGNYYGEDYNCTRVIRDNTNNNNLLVEYNRKASGGLTRVPMTLGQPFVLSLSNSEYVMDGVSYTPRGVTGNAYNSTLKILESANTKARIYYVKIGNKRGFIPCISPNGYAGLFDLKEGLFYRGDTNNDFTAGPVV